MDLTAVIKRVEALETQVENFLKGTNVGTTLNEVNTGIQVAGQVSGAVASAVAGQTTLLGKIEAALNEFSSLAEPVATIIDPGAAATVNVVATAMQGLLAILQGIHTSTVVPAASAPVSNPATVKTTT